MEFLLKVYSKVNNEIVSFFGRLKLKLLGVDFGDNLKLFGTPIISLIKESKIIIGNNVVLCSSSKNTSLGVNHPVKLKTLRPNSRIVLCDDVGVSGATICAAKSVYIGYRTMLGANVMVIDTDFHPISPNNRRYNQNPEDIKSKRVIIGNDVFIGANTIILKGVTIGNNSVIGAGSVVTSSIPENVIAAGNPCKFISRINTSK
ncbi:DapH/DapD/GlmU-related protein [Sporolactobacillus nakayamae]|uniref:Hexapeptide repeat of succinyl-transferase n=1 Tax=Sporolactobacillus nakayamae TaxID=269670 RepID=A0A1I2W146_9BACL|nr:DapH/DapD/GlmU-related protein [Sporolactobacillus nakayamae]SFG94399.1 Hexapeptide repeat of succinyl-transferase [Sporolactobacillus nakayamae]